MDLNRGNNQGFTLLEMTIALGIFVILFTLTLGIYSASIKAKERTVQTSKLQKEAELIMETLAKKIRSSRLNYDYYQPGGVQTPEDQLALFDQFNNEVVFRHNIANDSLEVCVLNCATGGSFNAIPSSEVKIDELNFFIVPTTDPFNLNQPPSQYPKITVIIHLSHTASGNTQSLKLQQTIPQRLSGW